MSTFSLYLGNASGSFIAGTYTGDVNSTDLGDLVLFAGQVLTGV